MSMGKVFRPGWKWERKRGKKLEAGDLEENDNITEMIVQCNKDLVGNDSIYWTLSLLLTVQPG